LGAPRKSFVISELPKKRSTALMISAPHYFTGKPCKHGHIEPRATFAGVCRQCQVDNSAKSIKKPAGIIRNREQVARFSQTTKGRLWKRRNSSKRRAVQRNALPQWAELHKISEFIAGCPPGFDVDHIIPLAGKNVCGLHVLENLQFLPKKENNSKYNKVDPLTLEANVCILPGFRTYKHI